MDPSDAARILLRRRRMRSSLTAFAQSIQIPGAPVGGDDSELFEPVGSSLAAGSGLTATMGLGFASAAAFRTAGYLRFSSAVNIRIFCSRFNAIVVLLLGDYTLGPLAVGTIKL